MDFREFLKNNIVFLDGATGTILQESGLLSGEKPEKWGVTHPAVLQKVHQSYYDSGSNVVCTNTFGANSLNYDDNELRQIVFCAVENAKKAKESSNGKQEKFIALDIGPTGKMLAPYGDLEFEKAVEIFAKTVRLGVEAGVDLVLIETMNDCYETKAALLAVKENCDLPVIVSNAYNEDGKLMTGASPSVMVATCEAMGVDAIGANCSFGPNALMGVIKEMLSVASVPVVLKPNAGLPKVKNGKTEYDVCARSFAIDVSNAVKEGVRVVGGCCGTTPEYIRRLTDECSHLTPVEITDKKITCITSGSNYVKFGDEPLLIGERINPTGKKRFKEALRNNDEDYVLNEAIKQVERGAKALDVNVGLPEIDEVTVLSEIVKKLQTVTNVPLQIDTTNVIALEKALRVYNGKALINSVNGKKQSMDEVFPLVKKYGGVVVALTLDEKGIPSTADERVQIALKIANEAKKYGINKKDIVFDTLTMAVSADKNSAHVTLDALSQLNELGYKTILGVSNISFGLPNRDFINSTFFALALERGLSSAIMNPYSTEMMKVYYSYCALKGIDENCAKYIDFATGMQIETLAPTKSITSISHNSLSELANAIIKGLRKATVEQTKKLLDEKSAMQIVNDDIIPALDEVGKAYERNEVFLPGLLMSAECAKNAFDLIKQRTKKQGANKCAFVIATVKGDVHDIGKNIVKLLLENYGFEVTDLGKDVAPEIIVDEVVRQNAPLVGLSALMTTTVPAMEQTIKLIRERAPWCKVVVGGAVLTEEYAQRIGADRYCKDAMETVRFAESVWTTKA